MKKIIVYLFCFLILAFGALAQTITITPVNPLDNDDLTCLVDNKIDENYAFIWYLNNNEIKEPYPADPQKVYILSNALTDPKDQAKCEVYAPTPWGSQFIGSAEVQILESPKNQPPTVNLPDTEEIYQDETKTINLNDYVEDDNTADGNIKWEFKSNVNIDVALTIDTLNQNNLATFTPKQGFVGPETIIFIATDEAGLSGSDEIKIIVKEKMFPFWLYLPNEWVGAALPYIEFFLINQPPVVSIPDIVIEKNGQQTLNLNNFVSDDFTPDQNIIWTFSGNQNIAITIDNANIATLTPAKDFVGTETITFTATDQAGLSGSDSSLIIVTEKNNDPTVTIIEPKDGDSFIINKPIEFKATASDPDGDTLSFSWDFGQGSNSNEQNPTFTYSSEGLYAITVKVNDGKGGINSDSVTINILKKEKMPPVAEAGDDVTSFVGTKISFDAGKSYDQDGVIVDYIWDFGDGETDESQLASHVYKKIGTYTVILTVRDNDGLTSTDTLKATITEKSEPIIINDYDKKVVNIDAFYSGKSIDIPSIMPMDHKEIYKQGEPIDLLIKVKNNGYTYEKVTISIYNLNNEKTIYKSNPVKLTAAETEIIEQTIFAPYAIGTQIFKISLTDADGDYEVYKYFSFTTA